MTKSLVSEDDDAVEALQLRGKPCLPWRRKVGCEIVGLSAVVTADESSLCLGMLRLVALLLEPGVYRQVRLS